MKIGVGRCHLHVGFPLVPQEEEPDAKCDVGASGTPNCCYEHEYQILYRQAPSGGDPIFTLGVFSETQSLVGIRRVPVFLRPGLLPSLFIIIHQARGNVFVAPGGALRVSSFVS
jgi:hypothetical protein